MVVGEAPVDWAAAGVLSSTAANAVALAKPVKNHSVQRAAFTDSPLSPKRDVRTQITTDTCAHYDQSVKRVLRRDLIRHSVMV